MKGIGILGCTPIRIPNHRDPNQQAKPLVDQFPWKKNQPGGSFKPQLSAKMGVFSWAPNRNPPWLSRILDVFSGGS